MLCCTKYKGKRNDDKMDVWMKKSKLTNYIFRTASPRANNVFSGHLCYCDIWMEQTRNYCLRTAAEVNRYIIISQHLHNKGQSWVCRYFRCITSVCSLESHYNTYTSKVIINTGHIYGHDTAWRKSMPLQLRTETFYSGGELNHFIWLVWTLVIAY